MQSVARSVVRLRHPFVLQPLPHFYMIRYVSNKSSLRAKYALLPSFTQLQLNRTIFYFSYCRYSFLRGLFFRLSSMWLTLPLAIALGIVFTEAQSEADIVNTKKILRDKGNLLCELTSQGDLRNIQDIVEFFPPDMQYDVVNHRHDGGWTALHAAAANNRTNIIEYLIEKGANINDIDLYTPTLNTSKEVIELRKRFCKCMDPNSSGSRWTPLHYAIAFGHSDSVRALIKNNADFSIADQHKKTPDRYIDVSTNPPTVRKTLQNLCESHFKKERIKFPMEARLRENIIGQVMPILSVSAALRRRDNGWHDEGKPLVFIFLGSSGVGKTMLAELVAKNLTHNNPDGFIRIDCSEYSASHELARMIGSPPGYRDHDQGGQLTSRLKKCPNAVVLLDEVEKAHPDVLTLMLQVFDEGRLTDGQGTTINCSNAVFIMTSNLVQDEIRKYQDNYRLRPSIKVEHSVDKLSLHMPAFLTVSSQTRRFLKTIVHPILKAHFKRDEFLGRINDMVVFHPFSRHDVDKIITMELENVAVKAKERHNLTLKWENPVVAVLTDGYDELFGFRSIKYEIQKRVINILAEMHERDQFSPGCTVTLGVKKEECPSYEDEDEQKMIKIDRIVVTSISSSTSNIVVQNISEPQKKWWSF